MIGIFLSLCLGWQPLESAYLAVPAAGLEKPTSPSSPEEDLTPTSSPAAVSRETPNAPANRPISVSALPLPKSLLSMDFQDADIHDVLHLLAVKSGLNIIYSSDVSGPVSLHLDQVPFDQAFQTVLTLKNLVALSMGPRIIRVVTSTGLTTEQSQAATFTKVFRLNYADASTVKTPIDAIRSAAGRKGISNIDIKSNSIVITDTQEGLKEVEQLIPTLDRKPQQVDIEAKIVEVSLDNNTILGVSWAFASGNPNKSAADGGPDVNYIGGTKLNTADPQPGLFGGSKTGQQVPISPLAGAPGVGGTGIDLGGSGQPIGFSFLHKEAAYLLNMQLSALAANSKVKILSTPHVVTLNNEQATINVTDKIPYQTVTLSQGISQTAVAFVESGVKLSVKPTINADRRITLKVKPEVSNPTGVAAFAGAPPTVNTRNAETTVLLRDGETIAIGGLIRESTSKSISGIPFLMSIPILGYLFRTTTDKKSRTELIVFLTPRIAAE